jgi:hypothetical protein
MRRTVPGSLILMIVAATTGCQTTGARPIEAPPDDLTVTRTFPARFDAVKLAMQEALRDHDALRQIAGFDYSTPVQTTSQTWKTPFRKVATRDMQNGERTLKVKVEQRPEGVVVTARLSTGTAGDPKRAAAILDRIAESVAPESVRR